MATAMRRLGHGSRLSTDIPGFEDEARGTPQVICSLQHLPARTAEKDCVS
jgi:hypothetical protein